MKRAMTKNFDIHSDDHNSQHRKTCNQSIVGEFPACRQAGI